MNNEMNRRATDTSVNVSLNEIPRATTSKHRIMMVDDHPIVREGMKQFINAQPDLQLYCEARGVAEALALMVTCNPVLVVCDISLKQESGLDLIKTLRRDYPHLGLLAMSQHDELVFAEQALRAGANGYLMKQEATANILRAIRTILAGHTYLSSAMTSKLALGLVSPKGSSSATLDGLSERELQVLSLLGQGLSTRQIADKLNRSFKTIESHRANLKTKLNLDSGTDLVHYAFTSGLGRRTD